MPLTELAIKNLKPQSKKYRVADGEGLCIEISPAGGKLWRLRYRYHGKGQMLALGKYPAVSLAEARAKRDIAKQLLESGKHLTREKKIEKQQKVRESENTFGKIARLEQYVLPTIGNLPIGEITIPDVVSVIEKTGIGGKIETAKRVKQIIAQVFRYATQRGLCQHNPAADLRDILPAKEERHFACIHSSELRILVGEIQNRKNDFTKYAMLLLLLTFVRTGELIGAKWEEINWDKKQWHIPKERMKMKRPHVVPLSRQVIAILNELQAITGTKEYIFHSASSRSLHISNGTVLMGLRRMGYKNKMTGHGFRTLASTLLNEQGYAPDVIERQLAHEDADKIRAAYNRAEYLPERTKMMQDYADFLLAPQKSPKVIKIATR